MAARLNLNTYLGTTIFSHPAGTSLCSRIFFLTVFAIVNGLEATGMAFWIYQRSLTVNSAVSLQVGLRSCFRVVCRRCNWKEKEAHYEARGSFVQTQHWISNVLFLESFHLSQEIFNLLERVRAFIYSFFISVWFYVAL